MERFQEDLTRKIILWDKNWKEVIDDVVSRRLAFHVARTTVEAD